MSSSKFAKCRTVRAGAAAAAMTLMLGVAPLAPEASAQPAGALPTASSSPGAGSPGVAGGLASPGFESVGQPRGVNAQGKQAPSPSPLRIDQLYRFYQSDAATDKFFYFYVVNPFEDLRKNHPEVMSQNLETVVRINNAAENDEKAKNIALDDDYIDPLENLSSGLGSELGKHFRDALKEGYLPKTKALLSGNLARGGGVMSSTFIEKYYYGYDRPFVVAPDRIKRYYREGQDDPYSTTPSYPSGHTNKAAWTSTLLSVMMPEVAAQIQARSSEAGQSRLVMGVHYPLDVIGGRMMGNQAAADRWADPEFQGLIKQAQEELRAELEYRCGDTIANCVAKDTPYMSNNAAAKIYRERMTYDFTQIGATDTPVVVPKRYAGLLETKFPELTDAQREQILAQTAIASGFPLDRNDSEGQHVRMNLAAAYAAKYVVNGDGSVTVTNLNELAR
nr:phosphatase PAP2 family protein [Corynebacterium lactis]